MTEKLIFLAIGILIGGAISYKAKHPFIPENFETLSHVIRYEPIDKGYKMTIGERVDCKGFVENAKPYDLCDKTILQQVVFFP